MYYQRAMKYWSKHTFQAISAHTLGGFGIALVLQDYFSGSPFLPVIVGWLFLAISVILHIMAITSK